MGSRSEPADPCQEQLKRFGRQLRKLRSDADLTQAELGEALGLRGKQAISDLERGNLRQPPDRRITAAWVDACLAKMELERPVEDAKRRDLSGAYTVVVRLCEQRDDDGAARRGHRKPSGDRAVLLGGSVCLAPLPEVPPLPDGVGPAALLDAMYEIVPFVETPEHSWLHGWLAADPARSACLLAGPAGAGKTRLALQICRDSEALGWRVRVAAYAPGIVPVDADDVLEDIPGLPGTLVIADYADRWPRADLQRLVAETARWSGRVRVLLVSRSELFWPLVAHPFAQHGFQVDRRQVTGPGPEQAGAMYRAARRAYAVALGGETADEVPEGVDGLRHALSVHVKALLDVVAAAPTGTGWTELSAKLVNRELHHWMQVSDQTPGLQSPPETLLRCTLVAVLLRGAAYPDALAVLELLGFERPVEILADHARLYPPPRRDRALWPLLPDRLGEDLIARSLTSAPDDDHLAGWGGPACDLLIETLLGWQARYQVEGETVTFAHPRLRGALAVLASAGERWSHVRDLLVEVIGRLPQLAVVAGGAVVAALVPYLPFETGCRVLPEMAPFAPHGVNLDLQEGAIELGRRVCADPRFPDLPVAEQIQHLTSLGLLLGESGRPTEAGRYTSQAAGLVMDHWVTVDDEIRVAPEADKLLVGSAFTLHAHQASAVRRAEEALLFSGLATMVLEQWVADGGDESSAQYLAALSAHATALAGCGRDDEALDLEKWLLARQLQQFDELDETHQALVSATLNNLGLRLREAGQRAEGLELLQHAETVRRSLAARYPLVFLPQLTEVLHNLAAALVRDGRHDEAVPPAEEAVTLQRRIDDGQRDAYRETFRTYLSTLAFVEARAQRWDEANATVAEYLALTRPVGRQAPTAVRDTVQTHLRLLHEAGRDGDARATLTAVLDRGSPTLSAWAALQLARHALEHDDAAAAAAVAVRHATVIAECDVEFCSADLILAVARSQQMLKSPFDAAAPVITAMLRIVPPSDEHAALMLRILLAWVYRVDAQQRDQVATAVATVRAALPFLRTMTDRGAETASIVADLCTVVAGHAMGAGESAEIVELLRLAVQARDAAGDDGLRVNVRNVLALAMTTVRGADLGEATTVVEEAVVIARRMARADRSAASLHLLATCVGLEALVHHQAGAAERALRCATRCVEFHLQSVLLGGAPLVPFLHQGLNNLEEYARDQPDLLESVWANLITVLPEQRRRDLETLREQDAPRRTG